LIKIDVNSTTKFIGIAGRIKSGKTTLARALAFHLDGIIIPFASTLKGLCSRIPGIGTASFMPQLDNAARKTLQYVGTVIRERINPFYFVRPTVELGRLSYDTFNRPKFVIVPDVRFRNELDTIIRELDGVVFFLEGGGEDDRNICEHVSEKDVVPSLCTGTLPWVSVKERVTEVLRLFNYTPKQKGLNIYLSMPMYQHDNYKEYYDFASKIVQQEGVTPVLPHDFGSEVPLSSKDLVIGDIHRIHRTQAVLSILESPSIGCAMELCLNKIVEGLNVVITTPDLANHPWLNVMADKILTSPDPSRDEGVIRQACWLIKEAYGLN
jgi:energy-coupling factor transporter ATP-binding protein EcfA2